VKGREIRNYFEGDKNEDEKVQWLIDAKRISFFDLDEEKEREEKESGIVNKIRRKGDFLYSLRKVDDGNEEEEEGEEEREGGGRKRGRIFLGENREEENEKEQKEEVGGKRRSRIKKILSPRSRRNASERENEGKEKEGRGGKQEREEKMKKEEEEERGGKERETEEERREMRREEKGKEKEEQKKEKKSGKEDGEEREEKEGRRGEEEEQEIIFTSSRGKINLNILSKLCLQPKDIGGLEIKKRTYLLKVYENVFTGSELVSYLIKNDFVKNREEGKTLGWLYCTFLRFEFFYFFVFFFLSFASVSLFISFGVFSSNFVLFFLLRI